MVSRLTVTDVQGRALVSGRPLGVRGDTGNAMCRPVQQAAERVLVRHLSIPSLYQ